MREKLRFQAGHHIFLPFLPSLSVSLHRLFLFFSVFFTRSSCTFASFVSSFFHSRVLRFFLKPSGVIIRYSPRVPGPSNGVCV